MSRRITTSVFSVLLIVTLSACNLQLVESPQNADLALTITAQALLLQQGSQTATSTVTVENQTQPSAEITATQEAVIPATVGPPATGAVTVTVSLATNCRIGPGQNFASVYGMPVGQVAEVVAKNTYSGYWIIKIPNGNGTCWLWGQYATVTGDTASLTNVVTPTSMATKRPSTATVTSTVPPSVTSSPAVAKPAAPSNVFATKQCIDLGNGTFKYDVDVHWTDNSNNEASFFIRVSDPSQFYDHSTSPNVEFINLVYEFPAGTPMTIGVTAHNQAGFADMTAVEVSCP